MSNMGTAEVTEMILTSFLKPEYEEFINSINISFVEKYVCIMLLLTTIKDEK